jgi:pimeloyl-ACP methyl ester carboxylesterase
MATEVFAPTGRAVSILCCLAGGPLTRRYWDLDVPGANGSHSFARTMAARGHYVVLADHLGIGESEIDAPDELTVEEMAAASHETFCATRRELPNLPAIGVGHSMGSMMTAIQQAHFRTYAAIALTGFANRGLDFPVRFHGNKMRPEVAATVKSIAARPPKQPAELSMVPGSIRPEMEAIDVPVLIANGDLDITGPIEDIPAGFPKAPSVTTVVLPETGHSHHAFEGRHVLYAALDDWVRSL